MDSLDLIERTIVALQAGEPLPPDVAQEWEQALSIYQDTPGASLDKLMGFKNRRGKRSLWHEKARREQLKILEDHCRFHKGKSKYEISCLMDEALQMQVNDYRVRNGERSREVWAPYAILYEKLSALPFGLPRQTQLYRLLKRLS